MVWSQKAMSLGVSVASIPRCDLNHWRSLSISDISAIGASQMSLTILVMRSNFCSGGVSRMAYRFSAAIRAASSTGNTATTHTSYYICQRSPDFSGGALSRRRIEGAWCADLLQKPPIDGVYQLLSME